MSLWLPGFERWELPGVPGTPYDEWDDPKALAHTTEGSSIDGAVSAYRAYPPHLIVDPVRRRKVQHIDLERAAYALWNGDADDSRCYQIEIVGFASQTHLWSDEVLRWLGEELARPLHEYAGVPYRVVWKGFRRDGEMGYALADSDSPLRLTQAELDSFSGWLGHQHVPGDDHWDPGGLNVPKILAYAANQEEDDMNTAQDAALSALWGNLIGVAPGKKPIIQQHLDFVVEELTRRNTARFAAIQAQLSTLASDPDITPDQLAAVVDAAVARHTPTAEQVAAAQLPHIQAAVREVLGEDNADQADALVDALAARLADK